MEEISHQAVEGQQSRKIYHNSYDCVKSVRGEKDSEKLQPLKEQRKVDGGNDPQSVNEDGKKEGERNADACPDAAVSEAGFSGCRSREKGSVCQACCSQMDKGKKEHGGSDEHKLHAGAGRGDDDFHSVVHISYVLYIYKRYTTQKAHPAGCGSQEPEQLRSSGPAVIVFCDENQQKTGEVEWYIRSENAGSVFLFHDVTSFL